MAVAEKSLTIRMTVITRKNDRLQRKFRILVCGLISSIISIKSVDRLQMTKQVC